MGGLKIVLNVNEDTEFKTEIRKFIKEAITLETRALIQHIVQSEVERKSKLISTREIEKTLNEARSQAVKSLVHGIDSKLFIEVVREETKNFLERTIKSLSESVLDNLIREAIKKHVERRLQ